MDFMPFESIYKCTFVANHTLYAYSLGLKNSCHVIFLDKFRVGPIRRNSFFSKIIRVCELRGSEERIAIVRGETFFGVS